MKRTMNKHLALLLAVLMLLTSMGINVIAAGEHEHKTNANNPEYYNVVNPTCTTQGYTEYLCVFCNEVVSTGEYTKALNHLLGEDRYEKVEGGYNKYQKCTRQYTKNGVVVGECSFRSYEMENGEKTLYHKVTFINNKVTQEYDADITYTKVAKTFKDQELYTCYVKHGDEVSFEGKISPYREKTVHYGKFKCIGWSTDSTLEATATKNLTLDDCADLSTITAELKDADLVLYPVFEGIESVYQVVFYNLESNITWPQDVNHGSCPKYSDPYGVLYPNPKKAETVKNYYEFNGWSPRSNQTEGVPTSLIESTPVYDSVHYHPTFKPVAKRYAIEFYDEGGKNLLNFGENGYAVFEGVNLDENFFTHDSGVYKDILDFSLTQREKQSDKEYRYVWAGWRVLRGDGTAGTRLVTMDKYGNMSFNGFSGIVAKDIINVVDEDGNVIYLDGELPEGYVADGLPNREPRKVIRLVPVFEQRLETYAVDVEMQLPSGEDSGYFRGDAVVTVTDRDNQLVANGKTNADGKFRCRLSYRAPFTVTVATHDGKYIGTATINELFRASDVEDVEAEINKCRVIMKLNPEYETHCGCIHHIPLIQPIFVRILNILYTFFNVKYVCCYDMTTTIGPLLDYVNSDGTIV